MVADAGVRGIIRTVLLRVPNTFKAQNIDILDTINGSRAACMGTWVTENLELKRHQVPSSVQGCIDGLVATHGPVGDVQIAIPKRIKHTKQSAYGLL